MSLSSFFILHKICLKIILAFKLLTVLIALINEKHLVNWFLYSGVQGGFYIKFIHMQMKKHSLLFIALMSLYTQIFLSSLVV